MNRLRMRQALGGLFYGAGRRHPAEGTLSVLMYHAVTAEPLNDPDQASVPAALFDAQMAALRRLGLAVVPLEEGMARLTAGSPREPMVSVVFDDGYVGVHDHALEILARYQVPATLFLVTRWIGEPAFPWAPPSLGRPLTWNEVGRLVREAGCRVGSHTHTHPVLATLAADRAREELRMSRAIIEERLGISPVAFAYPYGSYGTFSAHTRQWLAQEGFSIACLTVWGRHRAQDDPLGIKRLRVSWCDTPAELEKSLAGCYDWYRFVQYRQAGRSPRNRLTESMINSNISRTSFSP